MNTKGEIDTSTSQVELVQVLHEHVGSKLWGSRELYVCDKFLSAIFQSKRT